MVSKVDKERRRNLWEMITIASPAPDGMIPITIKGDKDQLQQLLTTLGFEFLVMDQTMTDKLRSQLDSRKTGKIAIDDLVSHLDEMVERRTDDSSLAEAFGVFDADNDGKLSLEEFDFFMTGFAKEYNSLFEKKIVTKMLKEVKKLADENEQFLIRDIIRVMKEIWRED